MHLPGSIRVSRTLRRLRSRFRPGIAILGYHRVHDGAPDPLHLSVSPAHFEAHLEVIARLAKPVRLAEAAAAIAGGRVARRSVVVTFDDGYRDNLHTVLPLLERYGVPATVFVTSRNRGGEFWWDRLSRLQPNGGDKLERLAAEIEQLPETQRDERLKLLEDAHPGVNGVVHRTLTTDELRALASSPLVEIGAHTVSHFSLPTLSTERQRDEALGSRQQLEALLGRPVTSFAYPHGALTAETLAIVAESGYTTACCSRYDVAAAGASLLALPRLWTNNVDGTRFERWLKGWLHGL